MRPGEQTQTQVNGGRVQRVCGCVEVHAEAFLCVEFTSLDHQPLRQLGIDTPVAALVGLSQSGTPHGRTAVSYTHLRAQRLGMISYAVFCLKKKKKKKK